MSEELMQIIVELYAVCDAEGGEAKDKADFILTEKGYSIEGMTTQ